ncbi:MAG: Rieske 2Fe-2S domain-containing protein [Henriciella sp.]|nr:Rieske 2Fe-2S domain-containing protein [Henriciella sp.]MBO6694228.1 Rieske 2Fe-2S domain-containing protein [Henriciella sp.]
MLTEAERTKADARGYSIDYERISGLHYLGNYVRRLPSNMARMMENAYDWEHLPFVHPSSFASIDLVDSGPWGWRARIGVPGSLEPTYQMLDLLVDAEKNYWVSTVFNGPGEGIEIHTQATTLSEEEIEVDVRFYQPDAPGDEASAAAILGYMQAQYATLYDEDIDLMQGRQSALEDRSRWRDRSADQSEALVGALSDLDPAKPHTVETATGRYCIRYWQDRWIAHSAVCPHQLGPLQDSEIDEGGLITCPWHGYTFNAVTGKSQDGACGALAKAPDLVERDGNLFLIGV